MRPIFLIGYMCSGKTTLGTAVGRLSGLEFIDLDDFIERRQSKTVKEIFDDGGEETFRIAERDALRELAGRTDIVIACGGGTPCFFDNMAVMNSSGTTVWLDAPIDRLMTRLLAGREKRPLIARMTDDEIARYVEKSLEARRPFYSQARERFDAGRLDDAGQISESTAEFIDRFIQLSR